MKRGFGILILLLTVTGAISFISDYTGAASRKTSTGEVHGFKYAKDTGEPKLTLIGSSVSNDGIPQIRKGESLNIELFPNMYVTDGYRIVEVVGGKSGAKKYGGFTRRSQGGVCNNQHQRISDKVCDATGNQCNCDIRIKTPGLYLTLGAYAVQFCKGSYDINKCNAETKGAIIQKEFRIVPGKVARIMKFFRGQISIFS